MTHISTTEFIRTMYRKPSFFRPRRNREIVNGFQYACEKIISGCIRDPNFADSLSYKRLFFLRREYRDLILNKLSDVRSF